MIFNIVKTLHIISVISWMAGLLYLPRIFVYHADPKIIRETSDTFKTMERRLYNFIMTPALILTWITGSLMIHYINFDTWLILKILFVLLLTIFHFYCGQCRKQFNDDKNINSPRFYRFINEVPTITLIIIVVLVIFQPF